MCMSLAYTRDHSLLRLWVHHERSYFWLWLWLWLLLLWFGFWFVSTLRIKRKKDTKPKTDRNQQCIISHRQLKEKEKKIKRRRKNSSPSTMLFTSQQIAQQCITIQLRPISMFYELSLFPFSFFPFFDLFASFSVSVSLFVFPFSPFSVISTSSVQNR